MRVTLEGEAVLVHPVTHEAAVALLRGDVPAGLVFADGYPSAFSLEVMDLLAGPRRTEVAGFEPSFVVRREDGIVVGEIGFTLDAQSATATVGYAIVEQCRRRGYATDALRTLVAYLRDDPRVRRIAAQTFVEHVASRRVMEKAGMILRDEHLGESDGMLRQMAYYEADAAGIEA
jgi:RimJ/RimL family protein N-acetyltransferase